MSLSKPFRRTSRQFTDGSYKSDYVSHSKYSDSPEHYTRAYLLIIKDLKELFDYVEPADENLNCFSYRIQSLLVRTCIEVEASCKAILKENGYLKKDNQGDPVNLNMGDYKLIEKSHHLSSYQTKITNWHGTKDIRTPFFDQLSGNSLTWFGAYNSIKHDRHKDFKSANFGNLLDAVSELFVLLSAQFVDIEFTSADNIMEWPSNANDGFEDGIGDLFRIKFPDDWPNDEKYDFEWNNIKDKVDPFKNFDYSKYSKQA